MSIIHRLKVLLFVQVLTRRFEGTIRVYCVNDAQIIGCLKVFNSDIYSVMACFGIKEKQKFHQLFTLPSALNMVLSPSVRHAFHCIFLNKKNRRELNTNKPTQKLSNGWIWPTFNFQLNPQMEGSGFHLHSSHCLQVPIMYAEHDTMVQTTGPQSMVYGQ